MPCFFVISGYTFKDKPGILKQRAFRLIQPYTYWSAIYFALFIILAYIHNRLFFLNTLKYLCGLLYSRPQLYPLDASQYFPLMPPGSGPLWFLTALFISYLLFLPLYRARPQTRYLWIGSYLLLHQLLHYCPFLFPWSIDSAFSGALFIYGGTLLRKTKILEAKFYKPLIAAVAILPIYLWSIKINGGSGGMYARCYGSLPHAAPLIFLIMGLTGSYIWFVLCIALQKLHCIRHLAALGSYSLTLLCSHNFVYLITAELYAWALKNYLALDSISSVVFIIQIAAAIVFANILHSIITKTKYRL